MTGLSGGALALAVAVLLVPSSPRHRLVAAGLLARRPQALRRRLPAAPCTAAVVVAVAVVLPVPVVSAGAVAAGTLVLRLRRRQRRRRAEDESNALDAALDVLIAELRIGAHPVAAFGAAAGEASGSVAASFRAVAARAVLGADVAAGLRGVAGASALPAQWERMAVCWELAEAHGLTMATLMRAAQRDVVERARFAARVDAGMAGARATAAVLAALPVLGIALGQLIGANPLRFLLSGGAGGWLLLVGVTLACGGLLWADRITGRVVA